MLHLLQVLFIIAVVFEYVRSHNSSMNSIVQVESNLLEQADFSSPGMCQHNNINEVLHCTDTFFNFSAPTEK